jgi:hypothetical protein
MPPLYPTPARLGCVAATLLAGCAASPAPTAPTSADGLRPALFFVGGWRGESVTAAGDRATLEWTLAPGLGGQWLVGEARMLPAGVEARDFWGQAPGGFVRFYLDNRGARGVLRSSGWSGATWVWEGDVETPDGQRVHLRETIARVDDATMHAQYEMEAEGAWRPLSEETLRRR